jgi:hypothetical protein
MEKKQSRNQSNQPCKIITVTFEFKPTSFLTKTSSDLFTSNFTADLETHLNIIKNQLP